MKTALVTVSILIFFVFALAPSLCLIGSGLSVDGHLSLQNFSLLLESQRQLGLLWHSIVVGSLTTLFASLIGIPFGAALARFKLPLNGTMRVFYLVPVILPTYVIGIALTDRIRLSGLCGIVLILGLAYWPVIALFTEKGLRAVSRETEDAALLLKSPMRVFTSILLPLALPSILMGGLLVFIFAISDFGIPDLLSFTSNSSYQVFSSEIFYRWDKMRHSGEAAVAALPVVLICLGALFLILRLEGKARRISESSPFRPSRPNDPGRWTWWIVGAMILVLLGSVVIPFSSFYLWLRRAGGPGDIAGIVINSMRDTGPDALNSISSSLLAATLMVGVGFFLAYAVERSSGWRRECLSYIVLLPLAFPAVLVGVGEIRFWNHPWNPLADAVYDQRPMLVLTYFARFIPIAVLSLRSTMSQVARSVEEASQMSGRGFLFTVKNVLLPLSWRGLWVAFILGYVLSMRELDTIAIIGAGNNTLPIRIYSQIHTSRDVIIAAHCVVLITTLLAPPLIYKLLVRGRVRIV